MTSNTSEGVSFDTGHFGSVQDGVRRLTKDSVWSNADAFTLQDSKLLEDVKEDVENENKTSMKLTKEGSTANLKLERLISMD